MPLGCGVVDIQGILTRLESVDFEGWLMVDLDCTVAATHPLRQVTATVGRSVEKNWY